MADKLRVAVCGFGRAGRIHLKNLFRNPNVKPVAVTELSEQLGAASAYLQQVGVKSPRSLLYTPDKLPSLMDKIDALVIATPTPGHEPIVKAGLLAKKAIFCEKPLASTLSDTVDMYKLAKKQDVLLFCSMNRRFDPTLNALRNALESGNFGTPLVVKTVARDHPVPPAEFLTTSGGMVHDCGIHDIDAVCWLVNAYPEEVFVMGFCYDKEIAKLGDMDTLAISMMFSKPRRFMATIDLSRHGTYGYDQRIEIFCEHGVLESQHQRQSGLAVTAALTAKNHQIGTTLAPIKSSFPPRYRESYKAAINHFVDLVKQGSKGEKKHKLAVPGRDVIFAMLIADAAEKSLRTGKLMKINYDTLSYE